MGENIHSMLQNKTEKFNDSANYKTFEIFNIIHF